MVSGKQIAAARALIGMTQAEVAASANISIPTLKRIEGRTDASSKGSNNVLAVKAVLEAAGVIFIDANGNGPGVRLRDRTS